MSKLKSSFTQQPRKKPTFLSNTGSVFGKTPAAAAYRDQSVRGYGLTSDGPALHAIHFGTPHTKLSGSTQSGTNWTSLLKNATSGGSSLLSDGLLSATGIGLIGKLFGLFGGSKSSPPVPTQFQSPVPQQNSITIGRPSSANSVSLGIHPLAGGTSGVYQQTGVFASDQSAHSLQVVQIVKQALLTSSSLNDVISEI